VTTATAGNLAGHSDKDKDKEKVEKRRALGRGLESLLPRVVSTFSKGGKDAGATTHTGPEGPGPQGVGDAALKGRSSTPVSTPVSTPASTPISTPASTSISTPVSTLISTAAATVTPATASSAASTGKPGSAAGLSDFSQNQGDPSTSLRAGVEHPQSDASSMSGSAIATGTVDYDPFGDAPANGAIEIQAVADTRVPSNLVVNLAISDIDKNPFQTRYVDDDDALEELSESIKANGVVQPIVVRPAEQAGRYVLILGERRLHASKKIEKTHIPALVRRVSEQQAAEMTIVENLQREDLSPLEQAQAFRILSNRFSLTQEQIAERVGLSRASIANYMRLLKLPREVMEMLAEKRINFAQAKELLKLGDNDRIAEAAIYAVKKGMNIEQIEMLVLRMDGLLDPLPDMPGVKKEEKEKKSGGARWVDPNVRAAQLDLERMLGVRVRIRDRRGRGKIVIEYSTVDDYERVVGMLRGKK
jgi:ParB family transcriptional regulator, chromosome partitioning protein